MNYRKFLQEQGYASKTIESNYIMLMDFLTWCDMEGMETEDITNRDLLGYIKYKQQKGVQQVTIQRYINAVKLFYNFQIKTGTQTTNPTKNIKIQGIKRKKLYHTFKPEELNQIYHNYKTEHPNELQQLIKLRNKVMLGLYVYQGIQSTELYKLEESHIQLREGTIKIPETRRSNSRTLQLESHQVLDLYDYILKTRKEILKISQEETTQLFISPKGGTDQSNYVTALMKELKVQNSSIKNAQQLRASVIVRWLRNYNLREVQYKAGHKYVSSTESFLVNEVEGLQEEVNQFHPLG